MRRDSVVSVDRMSLVFVLAVGLLFGRLINAAELNMRPVVTKPEPLKRLHPKLRWMVKEKVRAIWIGDDLFGKNDDGNMTKGQVLADAGFNLVRISMSVNSDDKPSGVVDTRKPLEAKFDRSKSTDLERRMAPNLKEARRIGLKLMIGFQYGTHHLEPYRKYRSLHDGLAKITCCPIDEEYITGQHIGKWAIKIAQGGGRWYGCRYGNVPFGQIWISRLLRMRRLFFDLSQEVCQELEAVVRRNARRRSSPMARRSEGE